MNGLLSLILLIGMLAFLAQALLKLTTAPTIDGTPRWKLEIALFLVAGICFFVLLGLSMVWDSFQQQESLTDWVPGISLLVAGTIYIWTNLNKVFKNEATKNWVNTLFFLLGLILFFAP